MLSEDKYFKTLSDDELWQRYCGFLELSPDEFMKTQKQLLLEEIDLVAETTLGKKIMGGRKPKSIDEFRQIVPLTTYDDYEPYLGQKQEDALAEKPYFWCHSSGRGGRFKWIPANSAFQQANPAHGFPVRCRTGSWPTASPAPRDRMRGDRPKSQGRTHLQESKRKN